MAFWLHYKLLSGGHQVSKGDRVYGGEQWGVIGRIQEEVIDTHSSAPPTWHIVSLGAASALSCSPTEISTEEETPIARAVSGSLLLIKRFADL